MKYSTYTDEGKFNKLEKAVVLIICKEKYDKSVEPKYLLSIDVSLDSPIIIE